MIRRLLRSLRRSRCPLCYSTCADVDLHQHVYHTPAELRQWRGVQR